MRTYTLHYGGYDGNLPVILLHTDDHPQEKFRDRVADAIIAAQNRVGTKRNNVWDLVDEVADELVKLYGYTKLPYNDADSTGVTLPDDIVVREINQKKELTYGREDDGLLLAIAARASQLEPPVDTTPPPVNPNARIIQNSRDLPWIGSTTPIKDSSS